MVDESVAHMRSMLIHKTKYKSDKWIRKVQAMSDSQVIAVYLRFREQKLFVSV